MVPRAWEARIRARCEIDLSPGTTTDPRSAADGAHTGVPRAHGRASRVAWPSSGPSERRRPARRRRPPRDLPRRRGDQRAQPDGLRENSSSALSTSSRLSRQMSRHIAGMRGGDPGEVAKAAAGVREQPGEYGVGLRGRVDERVGHHVGQVADDGEDAVVRRRLQDLHPHAHGLPEAADRCAWPGVAVAPGVSRQRAPRYRLANEAAKPDCFGAGDGVAADERHARGENRLDAAGEHGLGAADVRDDGSRRRGAAQAELRVQDRHGRAGRSRRDRPPAPPPAPWRRLRRRHRPLGPRAASRGRAPVRGRCQAEPGLLDGAGAGTRPSGRGRRCTGPRALKSSSAAVRSFLRRARRVRGPLRRTFRYASLAGISRALQLGPFERPRRLQGRASVEFTSDGDGDRTHLGHQWLKTLRAQGLRAVGEAFSGWGCTSIIRPSAPAATAALASGADQVAACRWRGWGRR